MIEDVTRRKCKRNIRFRRTNREWGDNIVNDLLKNIESDLLMESFADIRAGLNIDALHYLLINKHLCKRLCTLLRKQQKKCVLMTLAKFLLCTFDYVPYWSEQKRGAR